MQPEVALSGWRASTLGEVAEYINGFPFKPYQWKDHGLPIIRIAQMHDPGASCDYFPGELPAHFKIANGDLLFSWSATLMALIWNRGPAYVNQHIFKVIPASGHDLAFTHHLLNYCLDGLAGQSHGTTMKHVKRSDLLPFKVFTPPLPEQRRIAEILDTIDEAIRRTEQVIAKLRQMKQGLLHDLLTRGIDEKGELRDPEQHPEQFKDSPLGRIPRGWEASLLQNCLKTTPKNGYSPVAIDQWSGVMMLGLGCLTSNGFQPRQLKNAPRNDPSISQALLSHGDLLMSRSNTRELVGLAGLYREIGAPCIYPDLMMKLVPNTKTSGQFLEVLLGSPAVRRQIQAVASGTSGSMVKINAEKVRRLIVAVPSLDEQQRILVALVLGDKRIESENWQASKLRTLKHGLMDDLLTGRVRVTTPEEAAA